MRDKIKSLGNSLLAMKFIFPLTIAGIIYFILRYYIGKKFGDSFDKVMDFIGNVSFVLMAYYMYEQNKKTLESSAREAEEKNRELALQSGLALYDRKERLYNELNKWFREIRYDVAVYHNFPNSIDAQINLIEKIMQNASNGKLEKNKDLIKKSEVIIPPVSQDLNNRYYAIQEKLKFFFKGKKLEKLDQLLNEIYNLIEPLITLSISGKGSIYPSIRKFRENYIQFETTKDLFALEKLKAQYNKIKNIENLLYVIELEVGYIITEAQGCEKTLDSKNKMQDLISEVLKIFIEDFGEVI